MKTIKHVISNEIRRISDKLAEDYVNKKNSKWQYIPKEIWKKANGWVKKDKKKQEDISGEQK